MKMTQIIEKINKIIDDAEAEGCADTSFISRLSIKDIFDIEMYIMHKLNVRYWLNDYLHPRYPISKEINSSKTVYKIFFEVKIINDKEYGKFIIPRWGLEPLTECADPVPRYYLGMV